MEWQKREQIGQDAHSAPIFTGIGFLFLLTSIFFVNFLGRIVLSPLLPEVEADLNLSHAEAGSLFLVISAGYFISLVGSSFFSARFCHRRTLMISGCGVGAALIGVSASPGYVSMGSTLFFVGLGAGLYLPSAIVMITTTFHPNHWGKALAVHELAPNIGFVAAPLLAEGVMHYFSWRAVFFFLGTASLVQAGLVFHFARGGDFCGEPPRLSSFKTILSSPSFWRMVFLFSLGISGTLGLFAMLPVFLVNGHGFDRASANGVVALSRVAGAVMVFFGGWLTDRLGPQRVLMTVFFLSGCATLFIGLAPSAYVVMPIFIQPVIAVCFFPAGFAVLSQTSRPDLRNLVVSVTVPLAFLTGGGLIPTLIGTLGEIASFQLAFIAVALFIATGGFLSAGLPGTEASRRL